MKRMKTCIGPRVAATLLGAFLTAALSTGCGLGAGVFEGGVGGFEFKLRHGLYSKRARHFNVVGVSPHCSDPTISRNALACTNE